jgi:hypothetical protein
MKHRSDSHFIIASRQVLIKIYVEDFGDTRGDHCCEVSLFVTAFRSRYDAPIRVMEVFADGFFNKIRHVFGEEIHHIIIGFNFRERSTEERFLPKREEAELFSSEIYSGFVICEIAPCFDFILFVPRFSAFFREQVSLFVFKGNRQGEILCIIRYVYIGSNIVKIHSMPIADHN